MTSKVFKTGDVRVMEIKIMENITTNQNRSMLNHQRNANKPMPLGVQRKQIILVEFRCNKLIPDYHIDPSKYVILNKLCK